MARFVFDRSWTFDVSVDELWVAISRTDSYPHWWDWLDEFESRGLVEGSRTTCSVRSPLHFSLEFIIDIENVVPCELVSAQVTGDLIGPARLMLADHAQGSIARITWALDPARPLLKAGSLALKPLLEWGHNRIVDIGIEQFRHGALGA